MNLCICVDMHISAQIQYNTVNVYAYVALHLWGRRCFVVCWEILKLVMQRNE